MSMQKCKIFCSKELTSILINISVFQSACTVQLGIVGADLCKGHLCPLEAPDVHSAGKRRTN